VALFDHFADSNSEFSDLVQKARGGCRESIGELIERCRPYLLLIANQELDPDVRAKVGASDIVQDSLMSAQRSLGDFHGVSEKDLLAWLRGIVINDLKETRRHYQDTEKRDINLERPIGGDSQIGWPAMDIADGELTPGTDAIANEEMIVLRCALDQLPADYREVVRLRNWQQMTFAEIGTAMDRTSEAARKLWSRAVIQLQQILEKNQSSDPPSTA
jgi:RNA polymerase sigma-70 factor (ECF subfamily)